MAKKIKCAGCGKDAGLSCAFISIGVKKEVPVCGGYRYAHHRDPKKVCARKAREKAMECPGCGYEPIVPGTLCADCSDAIRRASALPEPAQPYYLDDTLLGPYLGWHGDGLTLDFLKALCRIAAPKGLRRWAKSIPDWAGWEAKILGDHHASITTGKPCIELDEDQKDAMLEIGRLITGLANKHRLEGVREGGSVLHQIINGELTVDEINDAQIGKEREYGGEEDDA